MLLVLCITGTVCYQYFVLYVPYVICTVYYRYSMLSVFCVICIVCYLYCVLSVLCITGTVCYQYFDQEHAPCKILLLHQILFFVSVKSHGDHKTHNVEVILPHARFRGYYLI